MKIRVNRVNGFREIAFKKKTRGQKCARPKNAHAQKNVRMGQGGADFYIMGSNPPHAIFSSFIFYDAENDSKFRQKCSFFPRLSYVELLRRFLNFKI